MTSTGAGKKGINLQLVECGWKEKKNVIINDGGFLAACCWLLLSWRNINN